MMSRGTASEPTAIHLLEAAERLERNGEIASAAEAAFAAAEAARGQGDDVTCCRALRRLAVLRHLQGDTPSARQLCSEAIEVAGRAGDSVLAAEAYNVMAGLTFESGDIAAARATYGQAEALGAASSALTARVQMNLGILANIQGDLEAAAGHYRASLASHGALHDERGRGLVLHNLGMLSADRGQWDEADRYYQESHAIADALGETHLAALCRLNHAEVHLARQQYEQARGSAEAALAVFERIESRLDKADAYRILGAIYRETGRLALAEARLGAARDLAAEAGSTLSEAEAVREQALLCQVMGRNQDALALLMAAHQLFSRLDARLDLVDVGAKRDKLEATYLSVVREWGQSIESADSYTFGHCGRVAAYAVTVARALGLDEATVTTIQLGAYLHDVGKIRVPHEILNKTGWLTDEEFRVIQQHPVWGEQLLEGIEFPWDIKPIIRWHHEKYDGSGYPDGLRGEAIPVGAQVLCIADVYDALTSTRSYRPAMTHAEALVQVGASRAWWSADVLQAFLRSVPARLEVAA